MRIRWLAFIPPAALLIGAMSACAADGMSVARDPRSTDDEAGARLPEPGPDAGDGGDAGHAEGGGAGDASLQCSDAGWCETRLPVTSADIFAIAPRESSAFALAWVDERTTLLAFDGASWRALPHEAWDVAPKGKQVLHAVAARSEDEVWIGGDGGLLLRGIRTSGTFTWTRLSLGREDVVRSIYVASASDVYVATDSCLFRWSAESTETFQVEYEEAETVEPRTTFREVVGVGTTELWLVGARANCAFVARKTNGVWTKIFDSEPLAGLFCDFRDPYAYQTPPFTKAVASGNGELTTLASGELLMRVKPDTGDGMVLEYASVPSDTADVWVVPGTANVFTAGFALVQESQDPWSGGVWNVSSVAFDGKPTLTQFKAVRGTDAKNLWVVGDSYALHKKTP